MLEKPEEIEGDMDDHGVLWYEKLFHQTAEKKEDGEGREEGKENYFSHTC